VYLANALEAYNVYSRHQRLAHRSSPRVVRRTSSPLLETLTVLPAIQIASLGGVAVLENQCPRDLMTGPVHLLSNVEGLPSTYHKSHHAIIDGYWFENSIAC